MYTIFELMCEYSPSIIVIDWVGLLIYVNNIVFPYICSFYKCLVLKHEFASLIELIFMIMLCYSSSCS